MSQLVDLNITVQQGVLECMHPVVFNNEDASKPPHRSTIGGSVAVRTLGMHGGTARLEPPAASRRAQRGSLSYSWHGLCSSAYLPCEMARSMQCCKHIIFLY